jgi:hypothetical protein
VPVFEFPIAIEDTTPLSLERLLVKAIDLAERDARFGGACVVLIHPNVIDPKLEFEKKLIEGVQGKAWTGSIRDFGTWWAARNAVAVDVTTTGKGRTVELDIPKEIEGLTVDVPHGWTFESSQPAGWAKLAAPGVVLLPKLSGKLSLIFSVS